MPKKIQAIYGAAIETKYLGPTNTRGGRIKATPISGRGKSIIVPYDHALSVTENHERVASHLLGTSKLSVAEKKNGFIFTQRK
jgi:hypothetical protein